jgi:hypothetical protein
LQKSQVNLTYTWYTLGELPDMSGVGEDEGIEIGAKGRGSIRQGQWEIAEIDDRKFVFVIDAIGG